MASLPWSILRLSGDKSDAAGWKRLDGFVKAGPRHTESVLAGRECHTAR
jgi:hypothetical protein